MDNIDSWMKRMFGQNSSKKNETNPENQKNFPSQRPDNRDKKPSKPFFKKRAPEKSASPQGQSNWEVSDQPLAEPSRQQTARPQRPQAARPHAPKPHAPKPQGEKPQGKKKPFHKGPGLPPRGPRFSNNAATRIPSKPPTKGPSKAPITHGKLRIIPLGGLNEIGKNMMALEYEDDIIIIDMGLEFPSDEMLGIDYVIPDVSYLEERKNRIRGIFITHGHLDHIGGIPYILPKLDFPPIYSLKLTIGLIDQRIEEFKQQKMAQLRVVEPKVPLKIGKFTITFFRVAHSIPDACGLIIDTPAGKLVHTGDFKFDETPPRNIQKADIDVMESLGKQNVLGLFCESTNALKPGHTMSEKEVGDTLDELVKSIDGRIILASFASQIGRIQQIIDISIKHNRKLFVSGRSMIQNIEICRRLGYLHFPQDTVHEIRKYKADKQPDSQVLILTTGSQGEAISALSRISHNSHPHIKAKKGDTIIVSSSPIVGNERAIFTVINNLCFLGAKVIHSQILDVHTSGHAKQDELIKMINYIKPKYLIPVHGEYFMRQALQMLAQEKCKIPESNIHLLQNGDVLNAGQGQIIRSKEHVETKYILIDGLGEGHSGSQVLVEREILSQNGALIILVHIAKKSGQIKGLPDVISRGFIYMHESDEITKEIAKIAEDAYRRIVQKNPGAKRGDIKKYIQQVVDRYTTDKLERRPLIVPLIVES